MEKAFLLAFLPINFLAKEMPSSSSSLSLLLLVEIALLILIVTNSASSEKGGQHEGLGIYSTQTGFIPREKASTGKGRRAKSEPFKLVRNKPKWGILKLKAAKVVPIADNEVSGQKQKEEEILAQKSGNKSEEVAEDLLEEEERRKEGLTTGEEEKRGEKLGTVEGEKRREKLGTVEEEKQRDKPGTVEEEKRREKLGTVEEEKLGTVEKEGRRRKSNIGIGRTKIKISKARMTEAIRKLEEFLLRERTKRVFLLQKAWLPPEYHVPQRGEETCKQLNWLLGEAMERGEAEEEQLQRTLSGMLSWPYELEEIGQFAEETKEDREKEMEKPDRNDVLARNMVDIFAAAIDLQDFRKAMNLHVEELIGLASKYPVGFFKIDQELEKTQKAIEEVLQESANMFREFENGHNGKRVKLRENIRTKFSGLMECTKREEYLEGLDEDLAVEEKKELDSCREDWQMLSEADWKEYFPKEREVPKVVPPETKRDLVKKFDAFNYSYTEPLVQGGDWFGQFRVKKEVLEEVKRIVAKLRAKWSIQWIRSGNGRARRAKLKRQTKTLETLASFGAALNEAVDAMEQDVEAHLAERKSEGHFKLDGLDGIMGRMRERLVKKASMFRKAKVESRVAVNVHLLAIRWAGVHLDLRLFLKLNNQVLKLYSSMKLLALATEEQRREAFEGVDVEEAYTRKLEEFDGQTQMKSWKEELGLCDSAKRIAKVEGRKAAYIKKVRRLRILHSAFEPAQRHYKKLRAFLRCFDVDEQKLKEEVALEMEGHQRKEKDGAVFSSLQRQTTQGRYKPEDYQERALRRVKELTGKVMFVYERILNGLGEGEEGERGGQPQSCGEWKKAPEGVSDLVSDILVYNERPRDSWHHFRDPPSNSPTTIYF